MKFLGTDYSAKHIRFEVDGKEYDVTDRFSGDNNIAYVMF